MTTSFVITIVCCLLILTGLFIQMNQGCIAVIHLRIDRQERPIAFWTWSTLVAVTLIAVAASSAWFLVNG